MCGIAGVVSDSLKVESKVLNKMIEGLVHRGPDGRGVEVLSDNVGFGHTRLSIVDLSENGRQPMSYQARYSITFNGEIYNFRELKKELEGQGYDFNSDSDTEVILASYDRWGTGCLPRFNGMWSFVIYDSVKNEIFISRDRFGVKPLFYFLGNGVFVFGSEIKAVIDSEYVKASPSKKYFSNFFSQGACEWQKETSFEGIYRFPQGSYFKGSVNELLNSFQPERFWKLKSNPSREKYDHNKAIAFASRYYELLKDSVRLRCRADVEVGSALSGGLDSSSIVYLVNQILKDSGVESLQKTFSNVYSRHGALDCDESSHIKKVVDQLELDAYYIEPNEKNIPQEHTEMIKVMENPPGATCMSGWHTYKLIHQNGVKISLDGQGADEQLGGYIHFYENYLTFLSGWELLKQSYLAYRNLGLNKFILKGFLCSVARSILGEKVARYLIETKGNIVFPKKLNEALDENFDEGLVNLLHYADRSSMGNSVESRMPFLDYRLVEFLASLPQCYKIHNGWTKYIARLAFDGKLDSSIVWRRDKMGWPTPEKLWFDGGLKAWLDNVVVQSSFLGHVLKNVKVLEIINSKNTNKKVRLLNISKVGELFFNSKSWK